MYLVPGRANPVYLAAYNFMSYIQEYLEKIALVL